MKKLLLTVAISTASILFSGCSNNGTNALQTPSFMKMKDVSEVLTDKELINQLAPFKANLVEAKKDRIVYKENIINFQDKKSRLDFVGLATIRFNESKIVNAYKNAVEKKGNTLKRFTGAFSEVVVQKVDMQWYFLGSNQNNVGHKNLPMYLEFDKNNNVVSALIPHTEYYEGYNKDAISVDVFYKIYTNEKVSFVGTAFPSKAFSDNSLN